MAAIVPRAPYRLGQHMCASCRRQLLLSRPASNSTHSTLARAPSRRYLSTTPLRPSAFSPSSGSQSRNASSVSQDEVSHFDALASSWWDPHGPSRLLHLMNPLRHSFLRRCRSGQASTSSPSASGPSASSTTAPAQGLTYLDIGCGGGIFAESAARLPDTASVLAIDPSSEVLAVAREHARRDPVLQGRSGDAAAAARKRLTYVNTAIEDLAGHLGQDEGRRGTTPQQEQGQQQRPEQFDVVSLFEVVEHVPYPSAFLREVLPYVRPGGWLVGSTISRTWASWFTTKLIAEDVVGLVPRGTHDWDKYINPNELRKFFAGLNSEDGGRLGRWEKLVVQEVMYVPGLGWKEVKGIEGVGNYFFGVRREA